MGLEHKKQFNDIEFISERPTPLTDDVVKEYPELGPKRAKIDTKLPFDPNKPTSILIPGIVITPDIVYRKQLEVLKKIGQNVVTVEYSDHGFSQELLQVQIGDFINSVNHNQKFNFIGISIGARATIDVVFSMPKDMRDRVNSVVLLGLVYSDLDLKNDFFGRLSHIANRVAPDQAYIRFAGLIKRYIKTDPMYFQNEKDEEVVSRQVADLSPQVIVDMFETLSESKALTEVKHFNDIKAGIGWWQDDHAGTQARKRVAGLFENPYEFSIQGHHGWTETGARDINAAIEKVIA